MHEQTDGQVKNNAAATISWCPFYGSREAQLNKRCYCMLHCPVLHWPLSGTTCVSQYQKGKPVWIQMKQETTGFGMVAASAGPNANNHNLHFAPDR